MGYRGVCSVFNSPNAVRHNPAGGVLGSDQRIQFAAFKGIKETAPAGWQTKFKTFAGWRLKNRAGLLGEGQLKMFFSQMLGFGIYGRAK